MPVTLISAVDLRGPLIKLFSYISNPNSTTLTEVVLSFFVVLLIIFMVFPIHECAHGLTAKLLGDDTAEREGRLTLNPFVHIEPIGVLIMMILPIGYAKPVNVNPMRFRKVSAKAGMALTAAAGPFSNILIAYVVLVITKIIFLSASPQNAASLIYLYWALNYAIFINLYLAVLNFIPVPPLDGSKILFFFLKPKWSYKMMQYQNIISMVVFILLLSGYLSPILTAASNGIFAVLDFLSGFLG